MSEQARSPIRRNMNRPHVADYESDDDDEHIIKIKLNSTSSERGILSAKKAVTFGLQSAQTYHVTDFAIAASMVCTPGEGDAHGLRIITRQSPYPSDTQTGKSERWRHVRTDCISIEAFENIALNFALEHDEDLIPVILHLLSHIRDQYEERSANGSYIRPGTVLRCDGTDAKRTDKPDLSAVFISFPYFDLGTGNPPQAPKDESNHLPRGLFKSEYPQEAAQDRDAEQMFRRFKHIRAGDYLRVPQLWAMVLHSRLIITCGPTLLPEMLHDGVEFVAEETLLATGPSIVHVTDALKRVVYLPLEHCRTYLALRMSIEENCFRDLDEDSYDYILHAGSSESVMEASQWPETMKVEGSAFIYVRLSRRPSPKLPQKNDVSRGLTAPGVQDMIEYGDLSSDDSSSEDEQMALTIRKQDNGTGANQPTKQSAYVEATKERLNDQGYIVNDLDSLLGTHKSSARPKPVIFRRPESSTENAPLKANSPHDEELPIPSQNILDRIEEVSETPANRGEMREEALIGHNQSASPSAPFKQVTAVSGEILIANRSGNRDFWDEEDVHGRPGQASYSSETDSAKHSIASEIAQPSVLKDEDAILGAQESDVDLSLVTSTISSSDSSLYDGEKDTRMDATEAAERSRETEGEEEENLALEPEKDGEDMLKVLTEQLTDMKRVIADEVAAALRHNTDQVATEVEKRVEAELRNRLAKSCFHPRMIDAVVNSGEKERSYLSYTRLPYNWVESDTIRDYGLDFKRDVLDPNFWIIFERLRPGEPEAMFEHTRRLRAEWSHRASRPRTPDAHPPVPTGAEGKVNGDNHRVKQDHRASNIDGKRSSSPLPDTKLVNPDLRVPPFLAWATTIEIDDQQQDAQTAKTSSGKDFDESALIQNALYAIDKQMARKRTDDAKLPLEPGHPFIIRYRSGTAFASKEISRDGIPEATIEDLLRSLEKCRQVCLEAVERRPDQDELVIMDNTHGLSEEAVTSTQIPTVVETVASVGTGPDSKTHADARRATQWQTALMAKHMDLLVHALTEIVDQFVPRHYPHSLLRRCWGALEAMVKIITALLGENHALQETEKHHNSLAYVIREIPHSEYTKLHGLEKLKTPLEDCSVCSRGKYYTFVEEAAQHLLRYHVGVKPIPSQQLVHWIASSSGAELEKRNEVMIELLRALTWRAERIRAKAVDMRNSVANENNEKPSDYLLPVSLVKAAEKIFQLIYTAQYSFDEQYRKSKVVTASGLTTRVLEAQMALLQYLGFTASSALSEARHELLLMAHTGDNSKSVQNLRSTPETTLLICILHLWSRALSNDLSVPALYREHLSSMRYRAGRHPSKLVLRDLYLLQDEFDIVCSICALQRRVLLEFDAVNAYYSHRISTRERERATQEIEQPRLAENLDHPSRYGLSWKDLRSIGNQFSKTVQALRYNIEVADESDSKAIRVFTLVTIIFLPLSFIASVFGMNTVDIRDMGSSQTLFWSIAIPVTTLIGGVSLLVAYHGSRIWEHVRAMADAARKSEFGALSKRNRRRRPRDMEQLADDDDDAAGRLLPEPGTIRRRKTKLKFEDPKSRKHRVLKSRRGSSPPPPPPPPVIIERRRNR